MGWLTSITGWFHDQLVALRDAQIAFFHDCGVWVFEQLTQLTLVIIENIPVPDFLSQYSLGGLFADVPGDWLPWMMGTFQLPACFAILSAGIVFRLTRKLFTLGQW